MVSGTPQVAIVGAGFFGFHIAGQLQRTFGDIRIEIFDREAAPLLGPEKQTNADRAIGFHYPRSGYTIYQSIMGFDRFVAEYSSFLEEVPDNIYAVHNKV